MSPTIVYVHGVGPQAPPDQLKRTWDAALFGHDMGSQSRMAYWADLRPTSPGPVTEASPWPRLNSMRETINAGPSSTEDFVTQTLAELPGPAPQPIADLLSTMTYHAEAIARGSETIVPATRAVPESLRIDVFREFLKVFIHDAYAYFYGGQRDPIRQRLRDQLAGLDGTVVVLGHSLGSVIAYDVVHDKTDLSVQLFVTIGSPLAVPEVEGLVAHPLEVPIGVNQWVNVAAAFDPVALDPTLADDYPPPSKCTDHMILNLPDPHSSDGYLHSRPVRTAIDPLFAIPSP
jgi:hypothetical protein